MTARALRSSIAGGRAILATLDRVRMTTGGRYTRYTAPTYYPRCLFTTLTALTPRSAIAGCRRRRTRWAWRGARCSRQARPPPPPPPLPRSMQALPAYALSCARRYCGSSTSYRATRQTPRRCFSHGRREGTRVPGLRWRRPAPAWPCVCSPWQKQSLSRLRILSRATPLSGGRASSTLASCQARYARSTPTPDPNSNPNSNPNPNPNPNPTPQSQSSPQPSPQPPTLTLTRHATHARRCRRRDELALR